MHTVKALLSMWLVTRARICMNMPRNDAGYTNAMYCRTDIPLCLHSATQPLDTPPPRISNDIKCCIVLPLSLQRCCCTQDNQHANMQHNLNDSTPWARLFGMCRTHASTGATTHICKAAMMTKLVQQHCNVRVCNAGQMQAAGHLLQHL
jgi:hypothetical protein